MAGLFEFHGKWVVTHDAVRGADGRTRRRRKSFPSKAEALAYMDANGMVVGKRKRPRTEAEVIDIMAAKSAYTDDGCLEWQGGKSPEGYGTLNWAPNGLVGGEVFRGAHRVSYRIAYGSIPEGKHLDHLCRNRACVRPDHLEPVSGRENVMRSPIAMGAINAAKTECPSGHPYSPDNTYVYTFKTRKTTTRVCRTCRADYYRRYRAAQMAVSA